jgi:type II secretion system protein I
MMRTRYREAKLLRHLRLMVRFRTDHPILLIRCRSQKEICDDSRGFTLIEVLVAIVILAVGLVTVIEAMARTEQAFRISQNLVTASQLLEDKLTEAELEVRQFHELRTGSDQGFLRLPGREFKWVKEIRPYMDRSMKDATKLNRVDVTIQWREGSTRQNQLALGSLIVNREKVK